MINRRTLTMLLTSLFAAGSVLWMQRKFEAADERNALAVVQGYRTTHASIPELLEATHPGRPVEWSTATESACFQHIRVHAVVDSPGAPPVVYAFTVDINGPVIHPANEDGRRLLGGLDAPLTARSAAPKTPSAPSSSPSASVAPTGSLSTAESPAAATASSLATDPPRGP